MRSLKPSSSGIDYILQYFKDDINPEDWVLVGDSWIDGEAAKRASVPFLAYNCVVDDLIDRNIPWQKLLDSPKDIISYLEDLEKTRRI